jgi:chromosome segregation ATPase
MVILVAGCTTAGGTQRSASTTGSMQETQAKITRTSEQLEATMTALEELVKAPKAQLKGKYKAYCDAMAALDAQREEARASADAMRARGQEYFSGWHADREGIANPELRQHSEARRQKLLASYETITTEMDRVAGLAAPLLTTLKDIQNVLKLDLTPDGVEALSDPVEKARDDADALREELSKLNAEMDKVAKLLAPAT